MASHLPLTLKLNSRGLNHSLYQEYRMCLHIINILKDLIDVSDMGEGSDGRNLSLYQNQLHHWVLHSKKLKKDLTKLYGAKKKAHGFGETHRERTAEGERYTFDTQEACMHTNNTLSNNGNYTYQYQVGPCRPVQKVVDKWVFDSYTM